MVREIESLDFGHLWLTDSSLHARNSWVYLTLAASNSSRLRLGTAVTNPVTRHPAITAVAAATLDDVSAGRGDLRIRGRGPPVPPLRRHPPAPPRPVGLRAGRGAHPGEARGAPPAARPRPQALRARRTRGRH